MRIKIKFHTSYVALYLIFVCVFSLVEVEVLVLTVLTVLKVYFLEILYGEHSVLLTNYHLLYFSPQVFIRRLLSSNHALYSMNSSYPLLRSFIFFISCNHLVFIGGDLEAFNRTLSDYHSYSY